jgi:L,D-transpeptidase catalytic domain/Putative peptidoglycan binding domain
LEDSTKATKANADVVPENKPRRVSRRTALVLGALAGIIVLYAAGAAWATYDYTQAYEGRLLPGAQVAGVHVGGLTTEQAEAAVSEAIRPLLDSPITVRWKDRSWTVTPREIGARNDAHEAVAAAIEASRDTSFFERMQMKVLGSDLDFQRDIAITYPRQGVRGFVQGIASNLDKEVRDATIDYSSGWVKVVEAREGREVLLDKSRKALKRALIAGESEVELAVKTVEPKVGAEAFDKVLLVRIGENKLYLYEDGKITNEWTVATGLPEYATPTGIFEVTEKRYLPTWVNPAPDTWGASMPAEIPPGPGNPLGLRAINWSAPAIRFHGTSATYSLGYNASHGCVRMSNDDVIQLYDMIDVGTPIVSTVVAPFRPLYASAPDPIVVAEDEGTNKPGTDADEPNRRKGD